MSEKLKYKIFTVRRNFLSGRNQLENTLYGKKGVKKELNRLIDNKKKIIEIGAIYPGLPNEVSFLKKDFGSKKEAKELISNLLDKCEVVNVLFKYHSPTHYDMVEVTKHDHLKN